MHEACIIRNGHLTCADRPAHIHAEDLAVILWACNARAAPVLRIDEVGSLEGLHLVILHTRITHKLRVELITLRVGDDEIDIRGIHPLGKRVGHGLRQSLRMRRPRHNHLRTLALLVLLDGDQVGETLQRMHRSALHEEDGTSRILYELVEYLLIVIILAALEAGERTYADNIAIATHDWDGLQQVLALVSVHDHAALGLEFPRTLIHV